MAPKLRNVDKLPDYNPKRTKTRAEVFSDIDENYNRYRYDKELLKIQVDYYKWHEYANQPDKQQYMVDTMKRFGYLLKSDNGKDEPFFNEEEYAKHIREHTIYNDEQISYMWKDYEKIRDLALTGQLERYKIEKFRENYIKAMEQSGVDTETIKNLTNLPYEKFKELVNLRNGDKDSPRKFSVPELGGFDYRTEGVVDNAKEDYGSKAKAELIEAFKKIGVKWEDFEDNKPALRILERSETRKVLRKLNRIYGQRVIEDEDKGIGDYLDTVIKEVRLTTKSGKSMYRRSKAGYLYIPFVGSTREGTKNEKLLLDIADRLGLDYKN